MLITLNNYYHNDKIEIIFQVENPEVRVDSSPSQDVLSEQEAKLAGLTSQLRAAYRGLEIQWWDETVRTKSGYEGSGAGSHPELFDDEDYAEEDGSSGDGGGIYDDDGVDYEGSGEKDYDDGVDVPAKPWNPWRTTTKAPPMTPPPVVERQPVAAGASWPSLTALKAVTTLLVPAVTCYIGGLATSLPFFLS